MRKCAEHSSVRFRPRKSSTCMSTYLSKTISGFTRPLQPVHRLPPELLSRIARCTLDGSSSDTSSIIPMTHVCRYWRESVISAPENWTRICSWRIGLAKLSLERCKAAPLELYLDVTRPKNTPGFTDLIIPYIQNTRIPVGYPDSNQEEPVHTLQKFLQSTPNLRSLTLEGSGLDWSEDPRIELTYPLKRLELSDFPLYPSLLRLRTLTNLTISDLQFNLHLDSLLEFMEENGSLETASLTLRFARPCLRDSKRPVVIGNRLQNLSISCDCILDGKALVSKIGVQRGANREVCLWGRSARSADIGLIVSTPHLLNLGPFNFMEYRLSQEGTGTIKLLGPNGSVLLERWLEVEAPFVEFPLLPLNDIRTFRLNHVHPWNSDEPWHPAVFPPLYFPALETFVIERETDASHLLSALFSNPSSPPSLKTLAFYDCTIRDDFMEKLTKFSSNLKNTTSMGLHRVVIVNSTRELPCSALVDELAAIVDVRIGKELPSDLKWIGKVG